MLDPIYLLNYKHYFINKNSSTKKHFLHNSDYLIRPQLFLDSEITLSWPNNTKFNELTHENRVAALTLLSCGLREESWSNLSFSASSAFNTSFTSESCNCNTQLYFYYN